MIRMILGWTMIGYARNHSSHSITKIIVQDSALLLKLMQGEARVSGL